MTPPTIHLRVGTLVVDPGLLAAGGSDVSTFGACVDMALRQMAAAGTDPSDGPRSSPLAHAVARAVWHHPSMAPVHAALGAAVVPATHVGGRDGAL